MNSSGLRVSSVSGGPFYAARLARPSLTLMSGSPDLRTSASQCAVAKRETQQSPDQPMPEAGVDRVPKGCALTRLLSAATDAEWNARARRTTPSDSHLERYAAAVAQK